MERSDMGVVELSGALDCVVNGAVECNLLATLVADALCKDKSKRSIEKTLHFLHILCALMKSYL